MKRDVKEIEIKHTNSGIKYQFTVKAEPNLFESFFGRKEKVEFYIGYGSLWYQKQNGVHKERCSSPRESWLSDQFAKLKLSLHKE